MISRHSSPLHDRRPSRKTTGERGLTLVELLVATCLALTTLAVVVGSLAPVLDIARAAPEAVDLHQRARAIERLLTAVVGLAGAGPDLVADGPLPRLVPALWPRRVGSSPDPPATAWADRFTTWHVAEGAAQAPLAEPVATGHTVARLAWHPACGTHPSCGFRAGDLIVLLGPDGAMAMSPVAAASGLVLTLQTPTDQPIVLPAIAAGLTSTAIVFDAGRRVLRRADGLAPSQPVVDDVVGLRVRYYGSASAPTGPMVPGADTCAVAADGTPRLGLLGPTPGPLVELTVADLADGPWCGSGAWRFDADLLRLRAVRVVARLQATGPAVRGLAPASFANPGQARRPGAEVQDLEVDVFLTAPNLAWGR